MISTCEQHHRERVWDKNFHPLIFLVNSCEKCASALKKNKLTKFYFRRKCFNNIFSYNCCFFLSSVGEEENCLISSSLKAPQVQSEENNFDAIFSLIHIISARETNCGKWRFIFAIFFNTLHTLNDVDAVCLMSSLIFGTSHLFVSLFIKKDFSRTDVTKSSSV